MDVLVFLVPLAAVVALVAAGLLARSVLSSPAGNPHMNEIADAVRQAQAPT